MPWCDAERRSAQIIIIDASLTDPRMRVVSVQLPPQEFRSKAKLMGGDIEEGDSEPELHSPSSLIMENPGESNEVINSTQITAKNGDFDDDSILSQQAEVKNIFTMQTVSLLSS